MFPPAPLVRKFIFRLDLCGVRLVYEQCAAPDSSLHVGWSRLVGHSPLEFESVGVLSFSHSLDSESEP